MPALIFLGRKWLIACDDFVVPCGIEAFLRMIWFICCSAFIWVKISNCDDSTFNNYFLYAAAGDLFFTSCLSFALMLTSARGSVLEVEKRKFVPIILFIKLITLFCDIGIASYGIWLFTLMEKTCIVKEIFIKVTTIVAFIYILAIAVGSFICYDTLGASKYWNIEANCYSLNFFKKAQYIWRLRLKFFCCCADISEDNDFIYVEISTFLASFLNGIDLVPTDVLSGIITLSQKHVLERRKHMLKHLPESVKLLESVEVPDWMTTANAIHFLRIAKSTYGWIAFLDIFHPWNLCILASQSGCCLNCFTQDNEIKNDNCCYLNLTAVQKISNFTDSDIIYASFKNNIHEPAFYIAIDHAKKYVVIAIRGTRSFSDLITDINAETLYFPSESKDKFKCHRGALRSALFVQNKIKDLNILERAFAENPTYTLALTGHSLGGSIAVILALLLRSQYPNLQCYAYGPLATLSAVGLPETLKYVLSVVVGEDMAPRLSATSCNELRTQLIGSLGESGAPKYQIIAGACWYHVQKYFKLVSQNLYLMDMRIKCTELTKKIILDKPYWLTGLNLQSIIINPHMIADHQPHRIQRALDMYMNSIQTSTVGN